MLEARLYLDYIDPGSYLMERRLRRAAQAAGVRWRTLPWEVRRPPEPLLDPDDPAWRDYWRSTVAESADGAALNAEPPALVPWTRKAHELGMFAREKGCFDTVHASLFEAFLRECRDIGRVDVLVELGREAGLDLTEMKAVLDVDRFAGALDEVRESAAALGVRGVPTLVCGEEILEGIHDGETLARFLDERKANDTNDEE